jgi:hypothetical protein
MKVSASRSTPVSEHDPDDLILKVERMWECFPHLHLPHKYGVDLLVFADGQLSIPNEHDLQQIYDWPWRKVQQYYVKMSVQDPGDRDSSGIRARLVGLMRARWADRGLLDRFINGERRAYASAPRVNTTVVTVKRIKK